MILLSNVSKVYPNGSTALDDISFFIERGEFVFIVGPSGSGKSTLIKLLMHEEVATSGQVIINNADVAALKRREIPYLRRSMGVVFQDFRLLPKKTVFENVAFAMDIIGASRKEIRKQVPNVLSLVGLSHKAKSYPNELSGGQKAKLLLTKFMLDGSNVLILDEPTRNFSPLSGPQVRRVLSGFPGVIISVSHDRKFLSDVCDKLYSLTDVGLIATDKSALEDDSF